MKQMPHIARLCLLMLVFPYAGATAQAPAGHEFRIMTYNVLRGFKNTPAYKDKFVTWISKDTPDIIAYDELSKFNDSALKDLCKSFGHRYTAFMETGSGFPIGLSSKYPITDVQRIKDTFHHGVMTAKVLDYNIIVLHLSPFNWEKRSEEIQKVIKIAQSFPQNEKTLVMGDFNALSPLDSATYNANPEMLERAIKAGSKNVNREHKFDYTVIGSMLKAGFTDSCRELNSDFQYTDPTPYYATAGMDRHVRIDYIWVNPVLKTHIKKCEVRRNWYTDFLSDHYPVLLTLSN